MLVFGARLKPRPGFPGHCRRVPWRRWKGCVGTLVGVGMCAHTHSDSTGRDAAKRVGLSERLRPLSPTLQSLPNFALLWHVNLDGHLKRGWRLRGIWNIVAYLFPGR